ncbi:restriction endonuclease subunit S [Methanosarcina barkeri]|uniref:Type I restriction-modification system S subunit HsdS6 n=1 Tax=Methanosarcina barkeri CM1 TaxID=796385 RepID=A0A0G3CL64_METBA|nr:restriction endonuclease subunit S [Methanosarcina barkeri]AKJ39877.1 type I restriction-modification system S subunit HsdS6 [Methanosarcina barkeri CM1]
MIHDLKPYPAYKDSGIPWLGDVPEHWEVKRNKLFLREINERSEDGSEELLTVSQYTGVTARRERISEENGLLTNAASLVGYKRVKPGDLVMNIMLAWNGSLGVSPIAGIASPAYCVYRATEEIESRFLHYLFRTPLFTGVFKAVSTGVVDSRLRLYPEVFFRLISILPPKEEQFVIVRYLDHFDRRIRHYIHAKTKLIKLLEEQKQAIIHQAVTRGLDPNVKLKPSGVEWLGNVPEHWEVIRLKQVTTPIEQGWSPQCDAQPATDDEWGVLKVGCVNRDFFDGSQNKKLPSSLTPASSLEIQDGDILVSRANTRELLGLAALAESPRQKLILCDKLFRFHALPEHVDSRFLIFAIRDKTSRAQIESSTNGASDSMQNIGQGVIRNLLLSLPPLDEQKLIVTILANQTEELVVAINRTQQEISLLREYRTRLIADVVTGKLDVREAATKVTDEAGEIEIEKDPEEEIVEENLEEVIAEDNN